MGRMKTQEQFVIDVLTHLGEDYEVLGQYTGRDNPVEMRHFVCGNTFMKRPHDIISKNSGCPFCNGTKPAKYNEIWVKENTPEPYKYISGYKTMSQKCLFHCDKCGTDFFQEPKKLINQHIYGCNCCPTKKKTHQEFLEEIGKESLQEYKILDEYTTIDKKIHFEHIPCGTIFELSPYQFLYKHHKKYCPICYYKKSKGEINIAQFLNAHQIDYQKEFIFPDLPNRKFDFFLPEYNICIEYDGEQHFMPIDYFGGQKTLEEIQKRDKEKNHYCIEKNILLIRIPYSYFDEISEILFQILEEKSSTTIETFCINKVEQ